MLVSAVSCASDPVNNDDDTTVDGSNVNEVSETETQTEYIPPNAIPAEEYDGVFKAGYARTVITPKLPAMLDSLDGQTMTKVKDDLYATCIAVSDGENTALLYTVDVKNIGPKVYATLKLRISVATKVPQENIIISATHSHSTFTPIDSGSSVDNKEIQSWTATLPSTMVNIAKEAIADMEDAEIYTGRAHTPNMAFVRRYLHADGTYSNKGTIEGLKSTTPIVAHAAEADDILQMIRFVRKDKKDIVMVNWQGHLAAAIDEYPGAVTADLAYYIRSNVEIKDDDILIAYFQGASGNLNLSSPVKGLQKYENYQVVGRKLAQTVLDNVSVDKLTKLQAGEIKGTGTKFDAERRTFSAKRVTEATQVLALETGSDEQKSLMVKYKFNTLYAAKSAVGSTKDPSVTTREMNLSAISFGDLGFIGAPYEMFDDNGMQIKDASPYSMTFILTCAGGYWAYVPSEIYYTTYGGYEVDDTQFAMGVAEKAVAEFVRMLKELKGIA